MANKGTVFALAGATGAERWRFSPKRIATPANGFWGGHLTSPVVSGGKVYIGAGQEIYALDAKTGALRWQFNGPDLVSSSVAVSEGRVFFSGEKNLHAIDASSGTPLWKAPVENEIYFAPIAADGVVYTTTGGKLAAYDARSGAQRWASREEDSGVGRRPSRRQAVRGLEGRLRAVDAATGKDLWSYQFNGYVSMPAVVVGKLFVVTGSGAEMKLAALDVATGKVAWEQQIPSLAAAPPVLGDGTVYVRTTDGRVLGFSQ
ncbi:MAG: PQQ-binding-like beta-propeller repeat protein [Chloroflexia bacterium]